MKSNTNEVKRLKLVAAPAVAKEPALQVIGDIGSWMDEQYEVGKKEFASAFPEWLKARANGQEAKSLLMFINIGKTERVGSFVQKDYYGKKLEVNVHKANQWLLDTYDLVAILEVAWNGLVLFFGVQSSQLDKEQTHDYTGEYYDVTLEEHIGLALQLNLSFNNAWFQMWRTVWMSGKIQNVDVAKIYRITD